MKNWKSIIGWGIAALVAGFIIYSNMQEQKALQNSGKRNIYAVLPLTGPRGQSGKDAKTVMDYYYQNGDYPFNLIYIDSETNPTKAITALQQKTTSEEQPIVIAAISSVVGAIAPYLGQKNGFMFAITAWNKDIPNFVRLHSDVDGMLEPMVPYLKQHAAKVALVYVEDEFGRLERNYLAKRLQEENIPMDELSISVKTLDVRTEVLKLKSFNPDAVVILGVPTQGYINVMRELLAQEYKGKILYDPALTARHVRTQLPNGIMGTCLSLEAEGEKNPKQKQFQEDLSAMGLPIFSMLIEAKDVIDLIKYSMENNLPFTQETYEKMKNWTGMSGNIKFLPKGDTAYPYVLVEHQDGKFIPVESEAK